MKSYDRGEKQTYKIPDLLLFPLVSFDQWAYTLYHVTCHMPLKCGKSTEAKQHGKAEREFLKCPQMPDCSEKE